MADSYGNDERIEALWAIKTMEHAEIYFNVSSLRKMAWSLKHFFSKDYIFISFLDFVFR
jgi:hypothetical protein